MRIMDSMKNVRNFHKEDIIDEELKMMQEKARKEKEQLNGHASMQVDQVQSEVKV